MKQQKLARDASAWGMAILVFIILLLVLKLNPIVSLVIAALVYLGLFFILNPKSAAQEAAETVQAQTQDMIGKCKFKLWQTRNIADTLANRDVRERIHSMCGLGDQVVNRLNANTTPLDTVTNLHNTFQQVQDVVKGYASIVTSKDFANMPKFVELAQKIEAETFTQIEEMLQNLVQNLSKESLLHLEVTLQMLETSLNLQKEA